MSRKRMVLFLHEEIFAGSDHGFDRGEEIQRFLGEREWKLQSIRTRVQEQQRLIKRQKSRTSFESVVSKDP